VARKIDLYFLHLFFDRWNHAPNATIIDDEMPSRISRFASDLPNIARAGYFLSSLARRYLAYELGLTILAHFKKVTGASCSL